MNADAVLRFWFEEIEPALSEYGAGHSVACHITTGKVTTREHVSV